MNTFECPVCGAEVRKGALSCRECGADERTGWNLENTRYDGMDFVPDDAGPEKRDKAGVFSRKGAGPFTWVIAAILLVVVTAAFLA
ncbi:MAG: zinc ribbon domain-containing protein [Opitutaceae bacterium]|nr:zinc ribbon domain-containing protein [Opitutaceae bacterium]